MKFAFRLEKVLQQRKLVEGAARRTYLEAKARLDEANKELAELFHQVDVSRTISVGLSKEGGAHSAYLSQIDHFISGQKTRIQAQRQKIRNIATDVEKKEADLVEAAKERRTLEKLRERRAEDHRQAERKKEAKEIDELVVTRFGRGDPGQ